MKPTQQYFGRKFDSNPDISEINMFLVEYCVGESVTL